MTDWKGVALSSAEEQAIDLILGRIQLPEPIEPEPAPLPAQSKKRGRKVDPAFMSPRRQQIREDHEAGRLTNDEASDLLVALDHEEHPDWYNRTPNPDALAALYDHLVWFRATREAQAHKEGIE